MKTRRNDVTMLSIAFMNTRCICRICRPSAVLILYLRDLVQYKACRQECSDLLPERESYLQVLQVISNSKALKGWVTQTLAHGSSARKCRARGKLFQSLGYGSFLSRYSTSPKMVGEKRSAD